MIDGALYMSADTPTQWIVYSIISPSMNIDTLPSSKTLPSPTPHPQQVQRLSP
jgi:hypothetical protein